MIQTGIFAEYTRSEQTYCALALADTLLAAGYSVHWLTNQHGGRIDDRWDRHVVKLEPHMAQAISWAKQCTRLIFMSDQSQVVQTSTSVNRDARRIHVPFLHRDDVVKRLSHINHDDPVAYSSYQAYNLFHKHLSRQCGFRVTWTSGMTASRRTWRKPDKGSDHVFLSVWVDKPLMRRCGRGVIDVLQYLLGSISGLHIYVMGSRPYGPFKHEIAGLESYYRRICWMENEEGEQDIVELLHQSDYCWIAAERQSTTWLTHLAMSCDALPIVWDVGPFVDMVRPGRNGRTLDTVLADRLEPIAQFDADAVKEPLRQILRPGRDTSGMRVDAAQDAVRAVEQFKNSWLTLLG